MQMRDYKCRACGHEIEILWRDRPDPRLEKCAECGSLGTLDSETGIQGPFDHIVKQSNHIRPDDVPGGFWIENLDKVPRWFPSQSAFQTELKARGLTTEKGNQWRGDPGNGSDKPRNGLSRWVAPPTISEPDRIKAWWEDEIARFGTEYMENTGGKDS